MSWEAYDPYNDNVSDEFCIKSFSTGFYVSDHEVDGSGYIKVCFSN